MPKKVIRRKAAHESLPKVREVPRMPTRDELAALDNWDLEVKWALHVYAAYQTQADELEDQLEISREYLCELGRRGRVDSLQGIISSLAQPGYADIQDALTLIWVKPGDEQFAYDYR